MTMVQMQHQPSDCFESTNDEVVWESVWKDPVVSQESYNLYDLEAKHQERKVLYSVCRSASNMWSESVLRQHLSV